MEGTPNGRKVSIMLEELKVPYEVHPIDINKDEQFGADFLALNPNNKIPVILDTATTDGSPFVLCESGAILIYLARKFCSGLLPVDERAQLTVLQWLMFQMGGIRPMFCQLHRFRCYASGEEYSLRRYQKGSEPKTGTSSLSRGRRLQHR